MQKLAMALAISISLCCAAQVLAQAPTLINFQGKLTDAASAPVNGPAEVVFSIYDAAGSRLWSEHHNNVVVKKAIFNILLGTGTPNGAAAYPPLTDILAANTEAWLEVQILDKTKTPLTWETMTPRQRLVSVAYSLHSQTAVQADDVPGMNITPSSVSITTPLGTTKTVINSAGEWTGAKIPSDKLTEKDPSVTDAMKEIFEDGGIDLMTEVQGVHSSLKDGINWGEIDGKPTSFGITEEKDPKVGSLSANHIPKWDDSLEALVNSSSIFENTTGVGLRTTDPKQALDVDGKIRMRNQTAATDAADTVATKGYVDTSLPGSLADGVISWKEIQGIPNGLDDGDNVGITSEADPHVKSTTADRIPKWDGNALVNSSSINENGAGNVGIGTTAPTQRLDVAGKIRMSAQTSATDAADIAATKGYVDQIWRLMVNYLTTISVRKRFSNSQKDRRVDCPEGYLITGCNMGCWGGIPTFHDGSGDDFDLFRNGNGCAIDDGKKCDSSSTDIPIHVEAICLGPKSES